MSRPLDVDAVTALVEHVAATVVAPRFRDLVAGEVSEKGPGDLVTVVDTEAETLLTAGLREILPGAHVVGEEAAAAGPELLRLLDEPQVFVVDPLDGTAAFVEGSPDHAVMVAYLEHGEAVAGWICLPQHADTLVAQRGAGAWHNGRPLRRAAPPSVLADLRGGVATGYLPDDVRARLEGRLTATDEVERFGAGFTASRRLWSGYEYSRLVLDERDALVYWRTWPWDHAPGAVLVREVGGVSRRFDGTEYRPGELGEGVLVAADEETWVRVRDALGL